MEKRSSLAKVVIRYDGAVTSVKVDGKELGDKVSKVTFTQCGGQVPAVTLELPLDEVEIQAEAQDVRMRAQWTGRLFGEMHIACVTSKQLAAEVGWHEKYLSAVLNGHREPKNAEATLEAALARLIKKREELNGQ